MRVAIIPPNGLERLALASDYHLVLPVELTRAAYFKVYHEAKTYGHYIILDNGAAEGRLTTLSHELQLADALGGVNEIVLPDVLGNMQETLSYARGCRSTVEKVEQDYKFTAVIQGRDAAECTRCFQAYYDMPWVDKIALPRHLSNNIRPAFRVDFIESNAADINERFGQVHCLGSANYWKEICLLSEHPLVQGLDTSLPIGAGLSGIDIAHYKAQEEYRRPDDYFTTDQRPLWHNNEQRCRRNLYVYGIWGDCASLTEAFAGAV